MKGDKIGSDDFLRLVKVNVAGGMSDAAFRKFIKDALPQVQYKRLNEIGKSSINRLTDPRTAATLVE